MSCWRPSANLRLNHRYLDLCLICAPAEPLLASGDVYVHTCSGTEMPSNHHKLIHTTVNALTSPSMDKTQTSTVRKSKLKSFVLGPKLCFVKQVKASKKIDQCNQSEAIITPHWHYEELQFSGQATGQSCLTGVGHWFIVLLGLKSHTWETGMSPSRHHRYLTFALPASLCVGGRRLGT